MRWNKLLTLLAVVTVVGVAMWFAFLPPIKNIPWLPVTKHVRLGLDLQGGVHVVLQAVDTPEAKVTPQAMKQVLAILQERVNRFGVTEPIIQQQGARRVIVELPGVKDPDEVVNTLIRTAFLEFKTESGEVIVTGRDLKEAREAIDPATNQPVVNLTFNAEGAEKFKKATEENLGRPIGIYLDGKLIQNPVVKSVIPDGKAQITGYRSLEEAHRVAVLLQSGALPVKLEILEKRTVGPTLGADSLHKSLFAGAIGVAAILIFMLLYYRVPGLIADFCLGIYALLVLLVFVALKATMTLPGIAGYLLSFGVAVDANILISERIKEELRSGKSLRTAVDHGFKYAFRAIFDANVTTVLGALVLYYFGTGPIRGFALTLAVGVIASFLTAVTMTRWLLRLVLDTGLIKNPKLYGA
ncbi:protein-export membrane protein SecD [Ammonifex degensii KC4]|uniref:Protein translocase subunit SecD n=1 Tax=Ammonifex degensii (strain DSM 10501 / KC4) TaxID=429009 RepID=C9R7V3_AMMDK|nr:protein translocase subunit SecD [Ammonifex degensii]ACX52382.1 protein-export membrane protein SecD [Ammonifex degensii KC4]